LVPGGSMHQDNTVELRKSRFASESSEHLLISVTYYRVTYFASIKSQL
jgi:hypothetical protein